MIQNFTENHKVQRRATKQVKSLRGLSYEQRLRKLNLPTVRYRRHRGDMIELYKILHEIYDTDTSAGIPELAEDSKTKGDSLKLVAQHSKMSIRRNCLSVRVVKPWSLLPEHVVSSTNFQTFKSRLDKVWSNLHGHRGLNILCSEFTDSSFCSPNSIQVTTLTMYRHVS